MMKRYFEIGLGDKTISIQDSIKINIEKDDKLRTLSSL